MRSVKFWRLHIQELSYMEKTFFKDMIKTLLSWGVLKEEVLELDLVLKILEAEIELAELNSPEIKVDRKDISVLEGIKSYHIPDSIRILSGEHSF